jgi:hypothetical protein
MATARRSSTSDDPMEQARRRAHQAFAEITRAKVAVRVAGVPQQAPRPFAGRGSVTRSEPVTCKLCIKYGATPEQSFLIHADPSPEPVPAIPSEDERDWLNSLESAERRTPGRRYAEISR